MDDIANSFVRNLALAMALAETRQSLRIRMCAILVLSCVVAEVGHIDEDLSMPQK